MVWNEKDHPRVSSGKESGGQFMTKESIEAACQAAAEELVASGKEIWLHEDGQNGFLLDHGDLQSLFSTNGQGERSVRLAIKMGAKTLTCLDGFLPGWFSKFGFREYKREANRTTGEPDVVYMRLED